jgi:hypothetical protein
VVVPSDLLFTETHIEVHTMKKRKYVTLRKRLIKFIEDTKIDIVPKAAPDSNARLVMVSVPALLKFLRKGN